MSRATELQFRHPKEIADAIYHPDVTYSGKQLAFKTNHVSSERIQKVLPFRSSNVRLPEYRQNERRQSPFAGPSTYNHHESFGSINPYPCLVKYNKPSHGDSDCFNLINGNQKIYIPAFEKPQERRKLIEQTKDLSFQPRAPLPKGLECATGNKSGDISHSNLQQRSSMTLAAHQTSNNGFTVVSGVSFDNRVAMTEQQFDPNQSTQGNYVPLAQNITQVDENAEAGSASKDYGRYNFQPILLRNSKSCLKAQSQMSNRRLQQRQIERSRVSQGGTALSNRHQRDTMLMMGNAASRSQAASSQNLNVRQASNVSESRFKMAKHSSVVELQEGRSDDVSPQISPRQQQLLPNHRQQQQQPITTQISQSRLPAGGKMVATEQTSVTNYASATKADSSHHNLSSSKATTMNLRVSAPSNGTQRTSLPRQTNRPQTAKYNSGRHQLNVNQNAAGASEVNLTLADNQLATMGTQPVNLLGAQMARVNSAKELPMKVFGKRRHLRSGRTGGQISQLISQSGFSHRKSTNQTHHQRVLTTTGHQEGSQQSFRGVAFVDGESHSFSLGGGIQTSIKQNRSRSRKRMRPNSKQQDSLNPIIDATLKERIKALKASKKISHRFGTTDAKKSKDVSPSRKQNFTLDDMQKKNAEIDQQFAKYDHRMTDPLVRIAASNTAIVPKHQQQRASSTKRGQARHGQPQQQSRVVKNIGMLQAYGEFDRFMQLSKHHMKQARRAQKLKEREKREFYERTAQPPKTLLYYDNHQTTIKSRSKSRKSANLNPHVKNSQQKLQLIEQNASSGQEEVEEVEEEDELHRNTRRQQYHFEEMGLQTTQEFPDGKLLSSAHSKQTDVIAEEDRGDANVTDYAGQTTAAH